MKVLGWTVGILAIFAVAFAGWMWIAMLLIGLLHHTGCAWPDGHYGFWRAWPFALVLLVLFGGSSSAAVSS
jgi:uncharacterized BrkB/YihY/UPF0761 family membrane protein